MKREQVARRPFNDLEKERALMLVRCKFAGGPSFARRLAKALAQAAASNPPLGITEKQAEHLARLCWTYRRQLPANLVPPAPVDSRPAKEQARLEAYLARHRLQEAAQLPL